MVDVDRIGDQSRRRIGRRRAFGQDGHRVGNAKGQAASAAAAGGDAAHRHVRRYRGDAVEGRVAD